MAYEPIPQQDYPLANDKYRDAPINKGANPFADAAIRQMFVRKVFSLLSFMVLVTTAVVSVFMYSKTLQIYVATNSWVMTSCLLVYFGTALGLNFGTDLRRKHPTNIILLTIFTLATSVMLGVVCTRYTTESVILAGVITTVTCGLVAVLALTTRIDFTRWTGTFVALLWVLSLTKLIFAFTIPIPEMHKTYATLGAGLFIMILIVDIQLIVGGKRMVINPEEYVFAALQVYLDIVNIFLKILEILGKKKDSERSKED